MAAAYRFKEGEFYLSTRPDGEEIEIYGKFRVTPDWLPAEALHGSQFRKKFLELLKKYSGKYRYQICLEDEELWYQIPSYEPAEQVLKTLDEISGRLTALSKELALLREKISDLAALGVKT